MNEANRHANESIPEKLWRGSSKATGVTETVSCPRLTFLVGGSLVPHTLHLLSQLLQCPPSMWDTFFREEKPGKEIYKEALLFIPKKALDRLHSEFINLFQNFMFLLFQGKKSPKNLHQALGT